MSYFSYCFSHYTIYANYITLMQPPTIHATIHSLLKFSSSIINQLHFIHFHIFLYFLSKLNHVFNNYTSLLLLLFQIIARERTKTSLYKQPLGYFSLYIWNAEERGLIQSSKMMEIYLQMIGWKCGGALGCFLNERNYGWWVSALAAYTMWTWETLLFHPCSPETLQQIFSQTTTSQKRKLFHFPFNSNIYKIHEVTFLIQSSLIPHYIYIPKKFPRISIMLNKLSWVFQS